MSDARPPGRLVGIAVAVATIAWILVATLLVFVVGATGFVLAAVFLLAPVGVARAVATHRWRRRL